MSNISINNSYKNKLINNINLYINRLNVQINKQIINFNNKKSLLKKQNEFYKQSKSKFFVLRKNHLYFNLINQINNINTYIKIYNFKIKIANKLLSLCNTTNDLIMLKNINQLLNYKNIFYKNTCRFNKIDFTKFKKIDIAINKSGSLFFAICIKNIKFVFFTYPFSIHTMNDEGLALFALINDVKLSKFICKLPANNNINNNNNDMKLNLNVLKRFLQKLQTHPITIKQIDKLLIFK